MPKCADCKKWFYDLTTGKRREKPIGRPVPRPASLRHTLPCGTCPKIPDGAEPCPENAVELSERNLAAYWYAQKCKADPSGTVMPRDEVTVENNAIVARIEEECRMDRLDPLPLALAMRRSQR